MKKIKPLVLLLLFLVILNSLYTPGLIFTCSNMQSLRSIHPSTAHATSSEPETIQGRVIYRARGPAVYGIGFTAALVYGTYGLGEFAHIFAEVGDLLNQMNQGQDETGTDFPDDWNDEDAPVHPADAGILFGHHEVVITFILEEMPGEIWQLQRGQIEWNGSSLGGGAAEPGNFFGMVMDLHMYDSFSDFGSQDLDPASDRITMRIVPGESGDDEFELELDVSHAFTVSGESQFVYLFPDFLRFRVEADQGNLVVKTPHGNQAIQGPEELSIKHAGRGPFNETVVETFEALFGTQVVIETTLSATCTPWIIWPEHNEALTFDTAVPGVLTFTAEARTPDGAYHERLEELVWTFPEIEGSVLSTDPEDGKGQLIDVTYTGLPADNNQFGVKTITARFDSDTMCNDPLPQTVRFLFDRDASNNPDGDVPNWFYYWRQTSAAQGLEHYMRFCHTTPHYGYYRWGHRPYSDRAYEFFIGKSACKPFTNPLDPTFFTDGIDTFAATVIHEWQHLQDYHDWWAPGNDPAKWGYDRFQDLDRDKVPDRVEPSLGLDPENPFTLGNILGGQKMPDDEVTAYRAMLNWIIGSANQEDWANPGKNSGGGN